MKHLVTALAVLGVSAPVQADVVIPAPPERGAPTARLTSLRRVSSDAPAADTRSVVRETQRALFAQQRRIRRCLRGLDLREDPFRTRSRTLTGRLVFSRGARPAVHIDRVWRVPSPARACIEEGVRAIAIDTAPRGTVTVRFTFTVR